MAELRLLPESEPGGVAVFFLIFGMEKFSSDAGSHWVTLFQQIGAGEWFRYSVIILMFIIGRPADSIFPAIFLVALAAIQWSRRRQ